MKKILILLFFVLTITISGCSKEKNNNDNENETQINKKSYTNYLASDPCFFNTAFSKDEEGNLYFVYETNVYKQNKDGSIEILLDFKDMNIVILKSKYRNGYLFMCVYNLVDPTQGDTGILRMNVENKELKMFETPKIHPYAILIDDKKMYLEFGDADWKTRYAIYDFNNDTGELSNYRLIEWHDYPKFIQEQYLKNKYPEYDTYIGDVKSTRMNYDKDTVYQYDSAGIEKINLKTYERELYYLRDIYGISGLLDRSLDIIDDRIYLMGKAGVTSYDLNMGDMQFIIDNRHE